ncbi:UTP--glucose-1-phosphate uridylyltransferase [Platysternon megacephalum]|uniref:UTP--glucose-1-phosphate uridylyltransferase n=1 Tax=Platysternon megacephalum TaxID=55544 RepID=A0A4D9DG86_9SAUR|nr:UTP--glucose-1-phosphate uridylyltransferase [Platysternon megacephalum]
MASMKYAASPSERLDWEKAAELHLLALGLWGTAGKESVPSPASLGPLAQTPSEHAAQLCQDRPTPGRSGAPRGWEIVSFPAVPQWSCGESGLGLTIGELGHGVCGALGGLAMFDQTRQGGMSPLLKGEQAGPVGLALSPQEMHPWGISTHGLCSTPWLGLEQRRGLLFEPDTQSTNLHSYHSSVCSAPPSKPSCTLPALKVHWRGPRTSSRPLNGALAPQMSPPDCSPLPSLQV